MSAPVSEEGSEEKKSESSVTESSAAVVETVECPNCGRAFVGDYCPDCGQEADPSTSIMDVIGGFFRELVDVENGFWATFVGLTLRPGRIIRQYLSGVRVGLSSPGRYLLASAVIGASIDWLLTWLGTEAKNVTEPSVTSGKSREVLEEVVEQIIVLLGGQFKVVLSLLLAIVLAYILRRLFSDQISRFAEALGIGCFLSGHGQLLWYAVWLISGIGEYLAFSQVLTEVLQWLTSFGFPLFVLPLYIGRATYGAFGPGLKSALKGSLGLAWTYAYFISIWCVAAAIYAQWLVWTQPEAYHVGSTNLTTFAIVASVPIFLDVMISAPLLVDAGIDAYYRLR